MVVFGRCWVLRLMEDVGSSLKLGATTSAQVTHSQRKAGVDSEEAKRNLSKSQMGIIFVERFVPGIVLRSSLPLPYGLVVKHY